MPDLRTNKINKLIYKILWGGVRLSKLISQAKYEKLYKKLLKSFGMNIAQDLTYIDPSAYFDNYDYSLITIGENVTISREVLFLTHDFSISQALAAMGCDYGGFYLKGITVGNNCFIGARVTLLPGTTIGDNSIIGAGAVVKGTIPQNSIVIGNPAKVIADTVEWGEKHKKSNDFVEVRNFN